MKNTSVSGGIVLYHGKDKKKFAIPEKIRLLTFSTVTIAFAGDLKQHRKIGLLKIT